MMLSGRPRLFGRHRAKPLRRSRRLAFESLESKEVPASVLLSGFTESIVATNLPSTTMMTVAPDGQIFLGDLTGNIRVMQNGQVSPTLFASLPTSPKVGQGLLGIALDPNFANNGWIYVYRMIDSGNGLRNQLSRVTASGNVMKEGSEVVLFQTPLFRFTPGAPPHNGGGITFGSDGKIYIPTGDLGNGLNAQSLNSLGGKVLRLNPDGTIPTDNPYYRSTRGVFRSIYALGLRNPYTVAAQPGTGLIYVNDVGGAKFEEIDQVAPRANYGWPNSEGYARLTKKITAPTFAYSHNDPDTNPGGTAIVGGAFYNVAQPAFPSVYTGRYFFGDYHNGWIKTFDPATRQAATFASQLPEGIVDIDATPDGRLLYLVLDTDTGMSTLRQIAYAPASPPALPPLNDQVVPLGRTATFVASPSGTGPFSYQWFVNGRPVTNVTDSLLSLPADPSLSGTQVHSVVTNAFGTITSNAATLTVLYDHPPQARITKPTTTRRYTAGSVISFAGVGNDAEDGALPTQAYTWTIDLLHNDHVHPSVWKRTGKTTGRFTIPDHADSGRIAFRLNLTVTDAAGVSTTVSRVFPVRA